VTAGMACCVQSTAQNTTSALTDPLNATYVCQSCINTTLSAGSGHTNPRVQGLGSAVICVVADAHTAGCSYLVCPLACVLYVA
jgi:hypothetical protein